MYFHQQSSDDADQNKPYSITCLEYDSTLPHRFMIGTEQGVMLSCNRKFKEPTEMVTAYYKTRAGPVMNILRNAFFPKLLASCGAWGVKVWSEDLTGSAMLNLKSEDGYCTDATWSPLHASFLFVTKTTGNLELWDILIKNHEPIMTLKLESDGLICILPRQLGDQIACGTSNGCIHLLNIPEYYSSTSKQEKNLVAAMIDRESKREKFLEGKTREQKLREKTDDQSAFMKSGMESNSEELYNPDDKLEGSDGTEFDSQFDPNLKQLDDEATENVPSDVTLFDIQFTDTLKTVVGAAGTNNL